MSVLALVLRFALSLMLAVAAVGKFLNFQHFCKALEGYGLIPKALVPPLAFTVGITELGISVGLHVGSTAILSGFVVASLFLVFSVAIAINLLRGNLNIECGCGNGAEKISWGLVSRNFLLSSGALLSVNAFRAATCLIVGSGCLMLTQILMKRNQLRGVS